MEEVTYTIRLLAAYRKGYRVINGDVISPKGRTLKLLEGRFGYYYFNVNARDSNGVNKSGPLKVHRLVAYQKYKDKIFEDGIVVRHLNGNCKDNRESNIAIGTQTQNMLDCAPKDLMDHSISASTHTRKLSDAEVDAARKLRKEGWTYPKLMERFGITSKGTMHHILNNEYKTKV